jgi:hypothetical protein
VFTVIAETVFANNGVVFGSGFGGEFNVVHSWTDRVEGLNNFEGLNTFRATLVIHISR